MPAIPWGDLSNGDVKEDGSKWDKKRNETGGGSYQRDQRNGQEERRRFQNSERDGPRQHLTQEEGCQIRVLNVPLTSTKEDLTELFGQAGSVQFVKLLPPKDGRDTCVSFITFSKPGEAHIAVEEFDRHILEGSALRVFIATSRNNQRQGNDESRQGYGGRGMSRGGDRGMHNGRGRGMSGGRGSKRGDSQFDRGERGMRPDFSDRGNRGKRPSGFGGDDGMIDLTAEPESNNDHGSGRRQGPGPVTYIPPPLPEDESSIFHESCSQGINFHKYNDIPSKTTGRDPPKAIEDFQSAGLHPICLQNVFKAHFEKPTPVQKHAIPVIINRRDLMACAQTGSGKTAAFLLPILTIALNEGITTARDEVARPLILVMVPTRELAIQIHEEARKFAFSTPVKCSLLYGGVSVHHQLEQLERGCHILVATPGRLADFILRGKVSLECTQFLVLDEADRMVDMGFGPQICQIMETGNIPPKGERQTMMFSATFPNHVQEMAADYLNDYLFVAIGIVGGACTDVTQSVLEIQGNEKRDRLEEILIDSGTDRTMVFVETKRSADFLASFLSQRDFPATSVNGDRTQQERETALREFTSGEAPILVATAVAARGLDIPDVKHVINYDLPASIDEYVHRVGRTGRIGNKGKATSFFDPRRDQGIVRALVKILSEGNQVVPGWLEENAMSAVGTNYGPEGGRFTSKDVRMGGGRRDMPRGGHRQGPSHGNLGNMNNSRHNNNNEGQRQQERFDKGTSKYAPVQESLPAGRNSGPPPSSHARPSAVGDNDDEEGWD